MSEQDSNICFKLQKTGIFIGKWLFLRAKNRKIFLAIQGFLPYTMVVVVRSGVK